MAKTEEQKAAEAAAKAEAKAAADADKEAAKADAEANKPKANADPRQPAWDAFLARAEAQATENNTLHIFEEQKARGEFDSIPRNFAG